MHGPPVSQLPHHDNMPPHQPLHPEHHRQDLPHHQQPHLNVNEPRPPLHHGQSPFHQQQAHASPRQMAPRPQTPQQRSMQRQRMVGLLTPPHSNQLGRIKNQMNNCCFSVPYQNSPMSKQMQPRNSNLRELPVAPGNGASNSSYPANANPGVRPVAKATQGPRPGQGAQPPMGGVGRGRGQVAPRTEGQPGAEGRTVVRKEVPSTQPSTAPQVSCFTVCGGGNSNTQAWKKT